MKVTKVVVYNKNSMKHVEFNWIGCDNLSDKMDLKLFIMRSFKGAKLYAQYDANARGWELESI